MPKFVLSIDQGTTSTRSIVYDEAARVVASASKEIAQHYPKPGWVEHDANEIWQSVETTAREALAQSRIAPIHIAGIGVTNQRETTVLWDRATGQPVHRAIVWQDRRTADFCREHQSDRAWLAERTGLILDPYFAATKIRWLLESHPEWRETGRRGQLAAGTIDCFLLTHLTGGEAFVTDCTNASRTLLMDLRRIAWDADLCRYFDIPMEMLPTIRPSAAEFGVTRGLDWIPDGIPILGVAGDQQAALFGQGAFDAGMSKCTYGTGAFFLLHTGERLVPSTNQLVTTLAAMIDETPRFALEGSVFVAGAAVQWLRDGLHLIQQAGDTERLARQARDDEELVCVPAFVGLGAPHWAPETRGAVFGLTRGTGPADLARAALDGVAFQVADLIDAARLDADLPLESLHVDGGMARNDWFLQRQADILGIPVQTMRHTESTALGAALLAGLKAGVWRDLDELRGLVAMDRSFSPAWSKEERSRRQQYWQRAVRAVMSFHRVEAR